MVEITPGQVWRYRQDPAQTRTIVAREGLVNGQRVFRVRHPSYKWRLRLRQAWESIEPEWLIRQGQLTHAAPTNQERR